VSISLEEPAEPSVANQSTPLTASAVFDLLSNTRRRCVIHFLHEEPETTVRELSRHVAAWENDVELSAVSAKQRKRVYTGLHQTHLPRLEDHGIVEYDSNRGDVRAMERLSVFEPYFQPATEDSRPWYRYYVGLGVGTLALTAASIVGIPGIAAITPAMVAIVAGTMLLGLAVGQAKTETERPGLPSYPDLQPSRWADEAPASD
jgi:DNA-binding transcriptional ArsR family regulator